jgi:hypothetical protein
MNITILWIVYSVVLVLLVIRGWYIGFKLKRYISKNHPKLYVLYGLSRGHWYPGNLFSRRMMSLIAKDDIGDPELIRLTKKGLIAAVLALSWFFLGPFTFFTLLIYSVCFR